MPSIKYVKIIALFEFKSIIARKGLILASTLTSCCHSEKRFASQSHNGKVICSTGTSCTTGSLPKTCCFRNSLSSFETIPLMWLQQLPQALHLNFGISDWIGMNILLLFNFKPSAWQCPYYLINCASYLVL